MVWSSVVLSIGRKRCRLESALVKMEVASMVPTRGMLKLILSVCSGVLIV